MIELQIHKSEEGLSLYDWLTKVLPQAPAGYLQTLLKRKIEIPGKKAARDLRLTTGDRVQLPSSQRVLHLLHLAEIEKAIVAENPRFLLLNKPVGIPVHAGSDKHRENLQENLQEIVSLRNEIYRVAPVHRLDIETTGAILFAKGHKSAGYFGNLLQQGLVKKSYFALVNGTPPDQGTFDQPIEKGGKLRDAQTMYRVKEPLGPYTLLEIQLLSGRPHQIRKHLSEAGYPLLADNRYGSPAVKGLPHLLLHCYKLSWHDPDTKKEFLYEVEPPTLFTNFCNNLKPDQTP